MENFDTISHLNEKAGMCVGYAIAYTFDKVVKVSLIYEGYKVVSRVANTYSIKDVSEDDLFNRSIDAINDAF